MVVRANACACPGGGTFSSTLPVLPKFTFTRVGPPATQVLDFGAAGFAPVIFQANGHWTPTAPPALNLVTVAPGGSVDHDCDAGTPDVTNLPGTTNFFAGVREVRCDAANCSPIVNHVKRLTLEQAAFSAHGVLPAQNCLTGDLDLDGFCDDADNCPGVPNPLQQDQDDDGVGDVCDNCPVHVNACQEDTDGDLIGDACETSGVENPEALAGVQLGRPQPNPVTGDMSFTVSLPRAGHVRVQVFDASGRLVRGLVDEFRSAGQHTFTVAVRDARSGLAGGVYVLRLEADGVERSRKFSVVR
jgi:hypothetical protein